MIIKKKKKKAAIDVINFNFNKEGLNNKRKWIKKTLFNVFVLKKNNYLNVNYIFIEKLDFNIYLLNIISDDYNILDIINQNKQVINLIILIIIDFKLINFKLNRNLITVNSLNLYVRIIINSDYSHYSFIDYSIFIIYKNTHSRLIKNIERSQI